MVGRGVTVAPLSLRSPTMFACAIALAMYMEVKPNWNELESVEG